MKKLILAVAVLLAIYTPVASACNHLWRDEPETPVIIEQPLEEPEEVEAPVVEPEKAPETEEVKAAATVAPGPSVTVSAVVPATPQNTPSWGK